MEHGHHEQGGKGHGRHIEEFRRRFLVSLALTAPVLALSETIQGWFGFEAAIPNQGLVVFLLSSAIYVYGGWPFLRGMRREAGERQPGMMTLMGSAISVAYFYSAATLFLITGRDFFWELATLIDVMLLGHWIEARSVLGASRALEELVRVMPTTAHRVRDREVEEVPVSELEVGDIVLVRPGEKVPSDGVVVEGDSSVNEALITGESRPVPKGEGAGVIGGSINGEGALQVRIEKTGEETYVSQVIELVRRAQESKSRTQDLADRAAALLFYVAVTAGAITYVSWFFLMNPGFALERSVTVLVIACPHALGLAIPLVVAISTSITARSGILIRERSAFEAVKDVDIVVFDKTGTLTLGELGVTDVHALGPEGELLGLAASVELNSEHIIAKAIVEYAGERGAELSEVEDFRAIPGKGAYGRVGGREVYVGGPGLMDELGLKTGNEKMDELTGLGSTVVFTVVDGRLMGAFALSDRVREESREAVEELKKSGYRVYMITGDAEDVAKAVAGDLGIENYFAQVLPDMKAERVKRLMEGGHRVAMVGDGINDAPALVTADVGIAIGAGTDVAVESADIILVKNDPRDVSKTVDLSRRTYEKMVQNLWWAAGYNVVTIPLAAGVLYGLGVVLSPAVGALLMSMSTVIVALNSQTLRRYEPGAAP